jgi:hypothetical protein
LKANILFSNELARRYKDSDVVSISVFPGALDADLKGYPASFFKRARKLVGRYICFQITCGDVDAFTDDISYLGPETLYADGYSSTHSDPTKVYHRAITPLYAGTAPEAGQLSGRVGVSGLPNCN